MSSWRISEENKQRFREYLENELNQARFSAAGYQFAVSALTPELEKLQNKLDRCAATVEDLRERIDALPAEKTACHSKLATAMENYDLIAQQSNQCLSLLKQLTEEFNERLTRVDKFTEIFREIPAVRMLPTGKLRQAALRGSMAAASEIQRSAQTQRV